MTRSVDYDTHIAPTENPKNTAPSVVRKSPGNVLGVAVAEEVVFMFLLVTA